MRHALCSFALIFLCMISFNSRAGEQDTLKTKNKIIKLNILSLFGLGISGSYERSFSEKNSFALTVYRLGFSSGIVKTKFTGVNIDYRHYFSQATHRFFIAPYVGYKNTNLKAGNSALGNILRLFIMEPPTGNITIVRQDAVVGLGTGYEGWLGKKMVIDIYLGGGVNYLLNISSSASYLGIPIAPPELHPSKIYPDLRLGLSLGYRF